MNAPQPLRDFPQRLHHAVPGWVRAGSVFHIRLRTLQGNPTALTEPACAHVLLDSVRHYHVIGRWHCTLFLLMPDHAHAMLAFPAEDAMNRTVGAWKAWIAKTAGIRWQVNFFDHRLRNSVEEEKTWWYIRRNPVVKVLCATEDDWPWFWPKSQDGKPD